MKGKEQLLQGVTQSEKILMKFYLKYIKYVALKRI